MSTDIKTGQKTRLCHIVKWDNFDGYGFNLHAEKGRQGQFIGKVDDGSPAEAAGLKQGDRILEVNGEPIADKSHKEVVDLVKKIPGETKLLVLESENSISNSNTNSLEKKRDDDHNEKKEKENGTLNLNMTAAELRAKLAAKKKFDPKKESMDFKQKYDIVQKL